MVQLTDGYTIVKDVYSPKRLAACKKEILDYAKANPDGCLSNCAGLSIPDHIRRKQLLETTKLKTDPKLITALNKIFDCDYRFCKHNDIGINRTVGWHKDRLNGVVRRYEKIDPWKVLPSGEKHNIVKVLIYLQDHRDNDDCLEIVPNSHLTSSMAKQGAIKLHPTLGDVIIFDQRCTHRGMQNQTQESRILVSYGFGENNVFTDNFEAGTVCRQNQQNSELLIT